MKVMVDGTIGFFSGLLKGPKWVGIWVLWLMFINLYAIAFLPDSIALSVLVIFLVQGMFMMWLCGKYGYGRILGLGHILWLALVPWLAWQITSIPSGNLKFWLQLTLISQIVSLVFDIRDVFLYLKEQKEMPTE